MTRAYRRSPSGPSGVGGANKSWSQEMPDPMTTVAWQMWVEINPHAAERLGVQDADVVRVVSAAGEVAMPIGQGHGQYGRYAKGHGSNPVELLASATDGETGALAWATTQVRIVPTGRCRSLARLEDPEGMAYLSGEGH